MSPQQISGQLRDVTDFTRRDIALAFLLAVDALLDPPPFDPSAARNGFRQLNDTEIPSVLFHIVQECLSVVAADPHAFMREHGYGLPAWLTADSRRAPLHGLWDRLTSERSKAWNDLASDLQRSAYLDELDEFIGALQGQSAEPPAQAVRDLPNRILAEDNLLLQSNATVLAARGARRGIIETEALARRGLEIARRYEDLRIEELAWRLIRFDFPVVISRGEKRGILLGAELGFGGPGTQVAVRNAQEIERLLIPSDIRKRWSWQWCNGAFLRGVRQGTEAALNLLRELRHPEEKIRQFSAPQIYLRGLLPPLEVTGGSIGLPVALEILRRALDLPVSEWVSSGEITESGEIPPLELDDLLAKRQAVCTDGIKQGILAAADQIGEQRIQLLGPKQRTLRDAAIALWGDEWHQKIEETRTRVLHSNGFIPEYHQDEPSDAARVNGEAIIVDTREGHEIVKFFQSRDHEFAFLGGASKSGKTWIARQAQRTLESFGTWRVDIVSVQPFKQPTGDEVVEAIRVSVPASARQRRLVIVDGLEWNEGLSDFEHLMRNEAQRDKISILAVARSAELEIGKWVTDDCMTFRSIQSEDSVDDLLNAVFDQFPVIEKARPLSGTIRTYAGRDIWWMIHLLALAAETGASNYSDLVKIFFENRATSLSPAVLETLKQVATLSLCSAYVPKDQIGLEFEAPLRAIGGHLASNRGWIIESRATANALLSLEVENGIITNNTSTSFGRRSMPVLSAIPIEAVLRRAIEHDDSTSVVAILARLQSNNPAMLSKVWKLMQDDLPVWGKGLQKPLALARVIDVLAPHLHGDDLRTLVRRLVNLVLVEWDFLDCRALTFCCRVLRRERSFIEDAFGEAPKELTAWHELVSKLERDGLGKVLERPSSSGNKLELVEELWRTYDDGVHRAIAKFADRLVQSEPPYGVDDYVLALRLFELTKNISFSYDSPPGRRGSERVIAHCENLARWEIPKEPPPFVDQILLRTALRHVLAIEDTDWREIARRMRPQLVKSIERSTIAQLCLGLAALAHVSRPFAVCLLDTINIAWLGNLLGHRPFSIGEVATLLGTINNLHAESAYSILYDRTSGIAKDSLLKQLKKRIHDTGDAKGAGRLLQATRKIDELFGSLTSGFSASLCRGIGTEFLEFNLRRDRRVSVLFHLIQGFISSDSSLSEPVQEIARDVIAATIERTTRPWAPQLALLLCELDPIGTKFAEGLVKRVDRGQILFGMSAAHSVEALESFHRLARFYKGGPEENQTSGKTLAQEFREKCEQGMSMPHPMRADRPDVVLRAIKAVGETLRRAGVKHVARDMLAEAVDDPGGEKATAADQHHHDSGMHIKVAALQNSAPGDIATTIRLWKQIDPLSAGEIVRCSRTQDILVHKLRRAVTEPHVAVDLLNATAQADAASGQALLERFRNRSSAWSILLRELAHEQNPVIQGTALLQLFELCPDAPDWNLRNKLYEEVWLSRMGKIASPRAIACLLKLFAAWDEQWGLEAAAAINTARLVHRIEQGCDTDLESAAGLIGTLQTLEQKDRARELALAVRHVPDVEQRASLKGWQILLPIMTAVEPVWGKEYGLSLSRRVARAAANPFILDEEQFWRTGGWLAYSCRQSAGDRAAILIEEKPPSFNDLVIDPSVRLWGTTWLAADTWVRAAQESAAHELLSEQNTTNLSIPAIVALARVARLTGQIDWSEIAHRPLALSASTLSVIFRASRTDDVLADWISVHIEDIHREFEKPWYRADFFVQEAKNLL
jgi:hypothetical protein